MRVAIEKHKLAWEAGSDIVRDIAQLCHVAEPCNAQRIFMSESELRKHFKTCNWHVWNSTETRLYYRCKGQTCNVKFKAKKNSDATWVVSNMPTCHSCSAPATPQALTSLVTVKDHLSEALVKEIERLGVTKSFRSKQIQNHLLSQDRLLVDTKLIHNIV